MMAKAHFNPSFLENTIESELSVERWKNSSVTEVMTEFFSTAYGSRHDKKNQVQKEEISNQKKKKNST